MWYNFNLMIFMNRRNQAIVAIILMAIITGGCTETVSVSSFSESDSDSILGVITRIETREQGTRILVEENTRVKEPLEKGGKKTWYSLSGKTELFRQNRNNSLPAHFTRSNLFLLTGFNEPNSGGGK
jgi:hypothetical protein